jgi:hypothetical protein
MGASALAANTIGFQNTALGVDALVANNGCYNTAVGWKAGCNLTTGSVNIALGVASQHSSGAVSNEVTIWNGSVSARFQGAAGAWNFVSDERDKTDIEPLPLGLEFIKALEPRKFKWDIRNIEVDKGKEASGFIAQEVLAVTEQFDAPYTGLVSTNDPEQYTFAAAALLPMVVNALKELAAEHEALKADYEAYKAAHS